MSLAAISSSSSDDVTKVFFLPFFLLKRFFEAFCIQSALNAVLQQPVSSEHFEHFKHFEHFEHFVHFEPFEHFVQVGHFVHFVHF